MNSRIALLTGLALTASSAFAQSYLLTNLVSDVPGMAAATDPNLVNGWGMSRDSSSPWWVSDNGTGVSTLYSGTGGVVGLVVPIPRGSGMAGVGNPTGQVSISGKGFAGAPLFAFVTQDGTISTWAGANATNVVDHSAAGAAYLGAAVAPVNGVDFLFVANFAAGTIEEYDHNYNQVPSTFVDPMLPAGFSPFNVQLIGKHLIVTYAKPDSTKKNEIDGPGLGYINVFDTSGNLLTRMKHGTYMNAPWGVAMAPSTFGKFSGKLLVSMAGNGWIGAFSPTTGRFLGWLSGATGYPVFADGIWGIGFGNGGQAGPTNTLYFAAGPSGGTHGLFGSVTAQ